MMGLFILLMSFSLRAEFVDHVPKSFCQSELSNCSEFSSQVSYQYSIGYQPRLNSEDSLYVGSCHMVGPSYDKNFEQFGYLYFKKNQLKIDFFGEFSFYANENPYHDFTLTDARKKHADVSNYQISEHDNHWQVRINPNPVWQYFIRMYNSNIQLIGFWGVDTAITCELELISST